MCFTGNPSMKTSSCSELGLLRSFMLRLQTFRTHKFNFKCKCFLNIFDVKTCLDKGYKHKSVLELGSFGKNIFVLTFF